jgi:hypothetical protein
VHEYRQMFLACRAQRVITYAGHILGFPGDTPEQIAATSAPCSRNSRSICSSSLF